MATQKASGAGRFIAWIAVSVVCVAVIASALWMMMGRGSATGAGGMGSLMASMGPTPMAAADVMSASAGSVVQAAVKIGDTSKTGVFVGLIVDHSNGAYRLTDKSVQVRYDSEVPVVMGASKDIRSGAIVQVKALVLSMGVLAAKQFVVLTGFVKVQ